MKLHTCVKYFFVVAALGCAVFGYKFYTNEDKVAEENYAGATDIQASFAADEEINQANKKLKEGNIVAAEVLTHLNEEQVSTGFLLSKEASLNVANRTVESLGQNEILPKVFALTFDGLPNPITTRRLLKLLEENKTNATFFVEGANASLHKETIEEIEAKGQYLGNYTYIGLSNLEKAPQKVAVKELCKAQKVLKVTANQSVDIFKAPNTKLQPELLKTAKACGLNKGVKTDIFVNVNKINSEAAAETFVRSIPAGSIVSVVIGHPVENIVQKEGKINDRPAVDKRPTVKISQKTKTKRQDVVEATKLLLAACKKLNTELVPVKNMRSVKLAEPKQPEQPIVAAVLDALKNTGNLLFGCNTAYAADHYAELRNRNQGKLAEEMKMVLTTEQAVGYSFVGFSKPQEVHNVLDRMQELRIHGTFFVGAKDIEANPALMKRIISEGHELGIAVYAVKNGNFNNAAAQIEAARNMLWNKYRISTNLVKQPWGVIEDYTKEAVAAENCILVSQNVNVVQTRHKEYKDAVDIMPELFGKFVYSVGRGWIVNFRMDFYKEPGLCADMLQILKEQKIDNIAYWSVNDDPALNPENDSAYVVKSVGDIIRNKKYTYTVPAKTSVPALQYDNNRVSGETLREYIGKRYIGTPTVNFDSNALGFTHEELRYADTTGLIHTNKPIVFFGFDDWGTDQAINKLLYVLRKHNVKGTFFILTNNVKNNPNLLRAIALEGHDIASHTNLHKPLALVGKQEHLKHGLSREERFKDLGDSYKEMERYVGDVVIDGHPALTKMFRPPTLTISKLGFEELRENGFEWIVSGSYSTHDYEKQTLYDMVAEIRAGLYERNKVVKGAVFIAHMSDVAKFTPAALDVLLTINEQRLDGDPRKFVVGRLSDYLVDEYRQDNKQLDYALERMRK